MRQRLALIALREEQCRPLRPAVCAIAGAGPPAPPRFPSDVPSACAGAAASGTFFSQRLGQLRTADAHALARFDLGAKANGSSSCAGRPQVLPARGWRRARRLHSSPEAGPVRCWSSAPRHRRRRRRCATREPYLRATPNASAILGLVQPASVNSTARARSASPRSRESARANRPARCSSLVTGDFPAMPDTLRISAGPNRKKPIRWLVKGNLLWRLSFRLDFMPATECAANYHDPSNARQAEWIQRAPLRAKSRTPIPQANGVS